MVSPIFPVRGDRRHSDAGNNFIRRSAHGLVGTPNVPTDEKVPPLRDLIRRFFIRQLHNQFDRADAFLAEYRNRQS